MRVLDLKDAGFCCCSSCVQAQTAASGQQAVQFCASTCAAGGFSLTIISPDYGCRCAGITPPLSAKLAESACAVGGKGVAVFYNHACKLHPPGGSLCPAMPVGAP